MKDTVKIINRSGMRIELHALPSRSHFSIAVEFQSGSLIERGVGETLGKSLFGCLHLAEHLSIRSPDGFTSKDFSNYMRNHGDVNAYTAYDTIGYTYKTNMKNMTDALNIVMTMAFNDLSRVTEEELEKEKIIVIKENAIAETDAYNMSLIKGYELLNGLESGESPAGRTADVEEVILEDLKYLVKESMSSEMVIEVTYDPEYIEEDVLLDKIFDLVTFSKKSIGLDETKIPVPRDKPETVVGELSAEIDGSAGMSFYKIFTKIPDGQEYLYGTSYCMTDIIRDIFPVYNMFESLRENDSLSYFVDFRDFIFTGNMYNVLSVEIDSEKIGLVKTVYLRTLKDILANFTREIHNSLMRRLEISMTIYYLDPTTVLGTVPNYDVCRSISNDLSEIMATDLQSLPIEYMKKYCTFESCIEYLNFIIQEFENGRVTTIEIKN